MLWLLAAAALAAAPRVRAPIPVLPAAAVALRPPVALVTLAAASRLAPTPPAPAGQLQAVAALAASLPEAPSPAAALEEFWNGRRRPSVQAQDDLGRIVDAAMASAAGRDVLARVAELGSVPVAFTKLKGDLGQYDYASGVMLLDVSARSADVRSAAATLVHELVHVLQHAEGLPAEALELELEAHAVTLEVMRDLGLKPDNPFSWRAAKKLGQGPDAFIEWMARQLPSKHRRGPGVVEELESEVERLQEKLDEDLRPAERARTEALLAWTERDLAVLRTRAGRARYARFARRVRQRLLRLRPLFAPPLP